MSDLSYLPQLLLPWFEANRRELPWRDTREPYRVWISEIMLQQTRVEAVKNYYLRFLQAFPTVEALAAGEEAQLLKLWEGLGYYNRARNLRRAARMIVASGAFPDHYDAIVQLPGIGAYTAGAIASICFEEKKAAVDGNVLRVYTRLMADATPLEKLKKQVKAQLEEIYPAGRCGDFTQALMELGATVCLPNGLPLCEQCPLRERCLALQSGDPMAFPVRTAQKPRRKEELTVFLLESEDRWALERRPENGLLAGLWQLPNVPGLLSPEQAVRQAEEWGCSPLDLTRQLERRHLFTHIEWEMRGYVLRCRANPERFFWANQRELCENYALPTAFKQFFDNKEE